MRNYKLINFCLFHEIQLIELSSIYVLLISKMGTENQMDIGFHKRAIRLGLGSNH